MAQQTHMSGVGSYGVEGGRGQVSKYPSGEAIQSVFDAVGGAVEAYQGGKAESAFNEEIAGIEKQGAEARNIVGDLKNAIDARSQEAVGEVDLSTTGGSLDALTRVAGLNEDPIVNQLRSEISRINAGTRQGIISPMAERAMKVQAAKKYINKYPAFSERLKNLADESLGYTMSETGVRSVIPALEDTEAAGAAAARKDLAEKAAAFGIYDIDNPATMRVLQQMAVTAHGRQLLASKGNVSALTAAETGDMYRMSAQEQLTKLTHDMGRDMIERGLDPTGAIPPDLVQKYSVLGRQIKDTHISDMSSSLQKAMVDKDAITTSTSCAISSPVDGWLKGLEECNAHTLNTDMLKALVDADKLKLFMDNPAYLRMVNMGVNPDAIMKEIGQLSQEAALTGGKDSPIWQLSVQNNKPVHKFNEIIQGALKSEPYITALSSATPEAARDAYDSLDDDTKSLVQATAQSSFKKGSKAPTTPEGQRTQQNMIALAAESMAKDGSKSAFTFETLANKTADFQNAYSSRPDAVPNQAKQTLYGATGIIPRLEQEAPKGTQFRFFEDPKTRSRHIIAVSPDGKLVGSTEVTTGYDSSFSGSRSRQGLLNQYARDGLIPGVKGQGAGMQLPDSTMRLIKSQMWATTKFPGQMTEGLPKSPEEVLNVINGRLSPVKQPAAETAPAPAKEGASASPAPAAKLTADFFRKNGTPEYLAKLEDGDYNSESTGVSVTISGGKVVAVNGELL